MTARFRTSWVIVSEVNVRGKTERCRLEGRKQTAVPAVHARTAQSVWNRLRNSAKRIGDRRKLLQR